MRNIPNSTQLAVAVRQKTPIQSSEQSEVRPLTFRELVRLYCLVKRPNASRDSRLKKWLETYGNRDAWSIVESDCDSMLDCLTEHGYASATVNREHTDIAAIYSWAMKQRRRTGCPRGFEHPLKHRERIPEEMRRIMLPEQTIEHLCLEARAFSYSRVYGLVLTALTSGARKNELYRMTWANTDLERGISEVGIDNKSRLYRTVLLAPNVIAELKRYTRHDPEALIFCSRQDPYSPYDERRAWDRIRRAIGRPDLHFHDLRHVATARMLKDGNSAFLTSRVLGHKDTRMVCRRYGALESGDLLEAVTSAAKGL